MTGSIQVCDIWGKKSCDLYKLQISKLKVYDYERSQSVKHGHRSNLFFCVFFFLPFLGWAAVEPVKEYVNEILDQVRSTGETFAWPIVC